MESSIWNTFLVSCTTFGVVFMVFLILYIVMRLMSLVSKFDQSGALPAAAAPAPVAAAPAPAVLPGQLSPMVVAAITAAIEADLGRSDFTITSITPVAKVQGAAATATAWVQQGRAGQMQGLNR